MSMQIHDPTLNLPLGGMGAMDDVDDPQNTAAANAAKAAARALANPSGSSTLPQVNPQSLPDADRSDLNPPAVSNFSSESLSSAGAACSSFFGSVLALIQQTNSEMLRQNMELGYEAQMQAADSIEKQADTIRDKAVISLVTGIVQGGLQIAGGAVQMAASVRAASQVLKAAPAADGLTRNQALMQALQDPVKGKVFGDMMQQINGKGSSMSQMLQGAGTATNAIGSYFAAQKDAELQEEQADQKRLEAFADQIKSINESFRQTVQSAIETSRSISQGMVETNKRILV